MKATPAEIFQRYFAELERRDIPYVILHSYEEFPDVIRSDVDYIVAPRALPKIASVLTGVAEAGGWVVAQTVEHDVGAFTSTVIDPDQPENFLLLDATSDYIRNQRLLLRAGDLLQGRQKRPGGFYVPRPSSELIYILANALVKDKPIEPHLARLRQLHDKDAERSQQLFATLLGPRAGPISRWLETPATDRARLRAQMYRTHRPTLALRARQCARLLRRLFRPTGFRLALTGPAELPAQLQPLLAPCFRQQHVIALAGPARWLNYFCRQLPAQIRTGLVVLVGHPRPRPDLVLDVGHAKTPARAVARAVLLAMAARQKRRSGLPA